jgi:hypothetical protein
MRRPVLNGDGVRLQLEVGGDLGADAVELDEATLQLRGELLELDVDNVERPAGGPPPPGTRGVESAIVGTLVVTATREVVGAVIRVVAGWLGRSSGRSVKLEIDGDSIEVTDPSAEDQRRLIAAFLERHTRAAN